MKKIPITYRLIILSIIKEMVKLGSSEYYNFYFDRNKKKMKSFSHASFIRKLEIRDDMISGDSLVLTISSSSYEFIMHLLNGSQRNQFYRYKEYELELINKRLLPQPPELTSIVTYKTLSPVLIENENKYPLLVGDKDFEKEFNYFSQLLARELFDRNLYKPLEILSASTKKVVIKENLHQSLNSPVFITANHGLIKLKGDPRDLKMIYENGVGRRRALGFGLLKIEEVTY